MQRYVDNYKLHIARSVQQGFTPVSFPRFVQMSIRIEFEDNGLRSVN